MKQDFLETILACPRCKTALKSDKSSGQCIKCKFPFQKADGIWHLLYISKMNSKSSLAQYDIAHQEEFGGPSDGSYEILAAIARGNKTVDIACGQGLIERLAPNTVGVEFSLNALKKARKNGARYLVLADAHSLPFRDNSFDIAICAGSLEHFENPQKAINEMARVAKIQVLTVHTYPPLPSASLLFKLATFIFKIKHQPIEKPVKLSELEKMLQKSKLHVVFKGVWTLPFNYGRVVKFLPEFTNIPSSLFVVSIKK